MCQPLPSVSEITSLQIDLVDLWHREDIGKPAEGLMGLVFSNHEFNFRLWHQEDIARSPTVSDSEIADVKRAIDRLNQARNDMIEKIDDEITRWLKEQGVEANDKPINTETAGSAVDRLSIMSLRLYHYQEDSERDDVDDQHRAKVRGRIELCEAQHADLSNSLQELLNDLVAGSKQHKTYRQMKMYNDPSLNPEIYKGDG
ncbi:MAG: DUF4254 domain-containing protein [Planctomycetota bacterium]